MPRAKHLRILHELPVVKGFRPLWMRPNYRSAVVLNLEEYEVLRLMDYEGLIHEEASVRMGVSRPTITRIYEQARKKLAKALVEGRSFLIEGGEVSLEGSHLQCEDCHRKFVLPTADPEPQICPECGSRRVISLSDCFIRGCHRCRRCR